MAKKEHGSPKFKVIYNPRGNVQPTTRNNPVNNVQAGSSDELTSTTETSSGSSSTAGSDEITEGETRSAPLAQSYDATTASEFTSSALESETGTPDMTSGQTTSSALESETGTPDMTSGQTTSSALESETGTPDSANTQTTSSAVESETGTPDSANTETTSSALESETGTPDMVSAQTSTRTIKHCFNPGAGWYHLMQGIDSLEKNHHFCSGNLITPDLGMFRILFGKYMCAFLNSPGGAIYYGVTKKGQVTGFSHTRKLEDTIRIEIDNQIKRIQPCVPTSDYNINFAMVMGARGQILPDLRVMVVKVNDRDQPLESQYTFKGIPYVWVNNRVKCC